MSTMASIIITIPGHEPGHESPHEHATPPEADRKAERIVQSALGQKNMAKQSADAFTCSRAMYWMSRYVERAEHIARIVLINSNMLIDLGELAPDMQEKQWLGCFAHPASG